MEQHVPCDAAEDQAPEPGLTARTDDDQACPALPCHRDDLMRRIALAKEVRRLEPGGAQSSCRGRALLAGEAFLLQGGDCAETFDGVTADNIQNKLRTLLSMAVNASPP